MISNDWLVWALLSALFASLTAIFAKIGLERVDSDYATLIRTVVIICVLAIFVGTTNKWQNPFNLNSRTLGFLILSGLATGASWLCSFRTQNRRGIEGSSDRQTQSGHGRHFRNCFSW